MNIKEYNARIIREYLAYKSEVPKNTYKGISADCKAIEKYLSNNNLTITSLSETAYSEQFISFLTEKHTTATVKRRLCTLRSLIYWCQEQGYISVDHDVDICDGLEIPTYHFAPNADIAKLYNFCKKISESEEYIIARAKLECLMVIICGFKVSELKKLRIQDVSGSIIDDKMKMVRCTKSECIDTFLKIRADLTDSKLIKSDVLFLNQRGNENQYINADFELIREQCNISSDVTLSSIRNSCIKECSILLNNDAMTAKLFDVGIRRLEAIKKQTEHSTSQLTDDEILLLEQYRRLTPTKKKDIIKLIKEIIRLITDK